MTTTLQPERRQIRGIKVAPRPFAIKAVDSVARTFEGIAAAYSLDLGGDVIQPGAFAKTLAYWREKSTAIPLINQHNYYDGIHDVLGSMIDAEERPEGLWAKFEVDDGPDGEKLMRHIEKKRINGLSIGYEIPAGGAEVDKDGIRQLSEIRLREVSAVIWPMNPDATIDSASIKSASEMSDDELREMRDTLDAEAKARAEKVDPKISPEAEQKLRAKLQLLRLRSLKSRTSGQSHAHTPQT
ncbi:MAG: HK97 family phage prohead protease [Vicinamibacterales bacterium]